MRTVKLHRFPRMEKLHILNALRDGLVSEGEASIESPAWHIEELKKTDERVRKGDEEILNWQDAKAELRERFE